MFSLFLLWLPRFITGSNFVQLGRTRMARRRKVLLDHSVGACWPLWPMGKGSIIASVYPPARVRYGGGLKRHFLRRTSKKIWRTSKRLLVWSSSLRIDFRRGAKKPPQFVLEQEQQCIFLATSHTRREGLRRGQHMDEG